MRTTVECLVQYVDHDMFWISVNMGEVREILQGFETKKISAEETERCAKHAIEYLDTARRRLDGIRADLKAKAVQMMSN